MQITIEQMKAALMLMGVEMTKTMPSATHKFMVGLGIAAKIRKLEPKLAQFVKDGTMDTDEIREYVDYALMCCGNEYKYDIDELSAFGLTPIEVTITKTDMDDFFDRLLPSVCNQQKQVQQTAQQTAQPAN